MAGSGKVYLVVHHHSDLIWRRTVAGYNQVREQQILTNLGIFAQHPEYRYCFAQVHELKPFLLQHPEHVGTIKRLVAEDRVELVGGTMSIADTNLNSGESLVRNLLRGLRFCGDVFGKRPRLAWLMDDFGMSAQLPQVLAGFGFRYLYPGRLPTRADNPLPAGSAFVWEGLDGTRIVTAREQAGVETGQYVTNVPVLFSPPERMEFTARRMREIPGDVFALYCTEEECMDPAIVGLVARLNREPGSKPIVFANPSEYYATLEGQDLPLFRGDFNPEFTGCYTTRIGIKQQNRAAESALFAAEALAALARIVDGAAYPAERLAALWDRLFVVQFHDGICGCHSDAVANELTADLADIRAIGQGIAAQALARLGVSGDSATAGVTVFNPLPQARDEMVFLPGLQDVVLVDEHGAELPCQTDPDTDGSHALVSAPPLGHRCYGLKRKATPLTVVSQFDADETRTFDAGQCTVSVRNGALRVASKFLSRDIFPDATFGRVLVRRDNGDLWTENLLGHYAPEAQMPERVCRVEDGPVCLKVVVTGEGCLTAPDQFAGPWGDVERLVWRKVFVFPKGVPEFSLTVVLDWIGRNAKVAMSFPTTVRVAQAVARYEIPFGHVARQPYYEVAAEHQATFSALAPGACGRAKGDWPALNWVDYSDGDIGLAVANDGTAGHQLVNGEVIVSLLRSPTEMASGFFPGQGALEHGTHRYRFLFRPHTGASVVEAVALGARLAHPLLVFGNGVAAKSAASRSFVDVTAPGVALSAFKQAENGRGYILRLYETEGKAATADIRLGFAVKRALCADLNEENGAPTELRGLRFKPFEIKTLLLEV